MTGRSGVLVIAGVDSSGGAGVMRDAATLRDHGVHAMCAVTAVTAQTDEAVVAVHPVPSETVVAQVDAALSGGRVAAIKIGMLGSAQVVADVARVLETAGSVPVVLDPVLRASSGRALIGSDGVSVMRERLLARCSLVTPNLFEVAPLTGLPDGSAMPDRSAAALLRRGAGAVLIKGGHGDGAESVDWLYAEEGPPIRLASQRLEAAMRGTGCALASAIAANLALGKNIAAACRDAKQYVFRQLNQSAGETPVSS